MSDLKYKYEGAEFYKYDDSDYNDVNDFLEKMGGDSDNYFKKAYLACPQTLTEFCRDLPFESSEKITFDEQIDVCKNDRIVKKYYRRLVEWAETPKAFGGPGYLYGNTDYINTHDFLEHCFSGAGHSFIKQYKEQSYTFKEFCYQIIPYCENDTPLSHEEFADVCEGDHLVREFYESITRDCDCICS